MQNNEEKKVNHLPPKEDVETHFAKLANLPLKLAGFILLASVIIGVVMSIVFDSSHPMIPWCVGGFVVAVTVYIILKTLISNQRLLALNVEKLTKELEELKSKEKDKE